MNDNRQTMYEDAIGLLIAIGFKEAIVREKLNRALHGEVASHARPIELALSADGDTSYPCSTHLKFPEPILYKAS